MDIAALLRVLAEGLRRHGRVALATVVETRGSVPRHAGAKMVVFPDGSTVGSVGGGPGEAQVTKEALAAMRSGAPRLLSMSLDEEDSVCGGEVTVFVDPMSQSPVVIMVGAGHVGRAVAGVAAAGGFRVVLLDDRAGAVRAGVEACKALGVVGPIGDTLRAMRLGAGHRVIIATRGHRYDEEALRAALGKKLGYLGMIGSRPKVRHVMGKLRAEGVDDELLGRVNAPVGLDIGAETPGEIAVAIVAEMVMAGGGGTGRPLKERGSRGATCQ